MCGSLRQGGLADRACWPSRTSFASRPVQTCSRRPGHPGQERWLYRGRAFYLSVGFSLRKIRYIRAMDARSPERADASSGSQLHASAAPSSAPRRIAYLESIRGLAAIQVLLLHFFLAFAPDLAAPNPSSALGGAIHFSPLYFLYDGYSAVYIFFCLSGYVLTRSFERQLDRPFLQCWRAPFASDCRHWPRPCSPQA